MAGGGSLTVEGVGVGWNPPGQRASLSGLLRVCGRGRQEPVFSRAHLPWRFLPSSSGPGSPPHSPWEPHSCSRQRLALSTFPWWGN